MKGYSPQDSKDESAPETPPGLLWGNLRGHFGRCALLAEKSSQAICAHIRTPLYDEERKEHPTVIYLSVHNQNRTQAYRSGNIQKTKVYEPQVLEIIPDAIENAGNGNKQQREDAKAKIVQAQAVEIMTGREHKRRRGRKNCNLLLQHIAVLQRDAVELLEAEIQNKKEQGSEKSPIPYDAEDRHYKKQKSEDGPFPKIIHHCHLFLNYRLKHSRHPVRSRLYPLPWGSRSPDALRLSCLQRSQGLMSCL